MQTQTPLQTSRSLRWYDYFTINFNWFALTTRGQTLTPIVIPLLVQQFVGESVKGAYLGQIRLWALMAALLMQALMGMLSDRSRSRWGRRRPFIVTGILLELVVLVLIGLSAGLDGMTGYWVLFGLYFLSMLASNISHAATQPLIADLVPKDKRGMYSGIKAVLELPLPLIFVSFVVSRMITQGNLWGALLSVMGVLLVSLLVSLGIPERKPDFEPDPFDWQPVLRLLGMTAMFTAIILGSSWVVNVVIRQTVDLAGGSILWLVGAAGLAGMSVAIVLGVWSSLRISLGEEAKANSSFTFWVINRLAFLVGANNLAGFMVYFLQEKFVEFQGEKAAGPASMIIMFVGILILLTALPSGWLADRIGKRKLLVISGALAAAGTLVVIMAPSLGVIYVGACMVGAGVGFFYPASWALGTEIVPPERAGKFLGISNLAGAGAGAVGAYIGGTIADSNSYVLLMSIYGFVFVLSILMVRWIKVGEG
ncbi:MAG: MFS transporter [Anaerolineales bacterium]|nr:MFS transporter [Anaerolineales bacterium]